MSEPFESPVNQALRERAMGYRGTTEGASCVNRAFKAGGKKNFLFLGEKDGRCKLMLRLGDSAAAVPELTADWPGEWPVGKTGWLNAKYPAEAELPVDVLEKWLEESFRLIAPKSVQKAHDAG